MRYILLVVALLEVCDVTKHGSHLGSHLGFYQKLNSGKNSKNKQFLRLTRKITKIITLHHFIHKLYFYSWKKLKKHTSHSKTAWPPATYDVISRNHSNWSSLNLSQNAREGLTNSYRKLQVLMFYRLGKKCRKTLGGGCQPPPSPLYVQGLIRIMFSVITVDFPYGLWQRLIYKLQENKPVLLAGLLIHNRDKKNRKRRQYKRIIILLACNCPHCYQNQYKENSSLH